MPYIKPHRVLTIENTPTELHFTVDGRGIDVQTHMFNNFHELWVPKGTGSVAVTSNGEGIYLKHRSSKIDLQNGVTTSLALDSNYESYDVYLNNHPNKVDTLVIKCL